MFEVKTMNTLEEYAKYVRAVIAANRSTETASFRRERVIMVSLSAAVGIVFVVCLLYLYSQTHESWLLTMAVVILAVFLYGAYRVVNFVRMYRTPKDEQLIRRMWENAVKIRGEEYTLVFGEDGFEVSLRELSANIKYSAVTRLIETQTDLYLMTGGIDQGLIVNKQPLTKEQCLFIRTHCSSADRPQITV